MQTICWAAQVVRIHLPMQQMQETQVKSLGWEDHLEKEKATYSSILTWKNPMDRGAWQATVHGDAKSQTWLSTYQQQTICHTPAFRKLL